MCNSLYKRLCIAIFLHIKHIGISKIYYCPGERGCHDVDVKNHYFLYFCNDLVACNHFHCAENISCNMHTCWWSTMSGILCKGFITFKWQNEWAVKKTPKCITAMWFSWQELIKSVFPKERRCWRHTSTHSFSPWNIPLSREKGGLKDSWARPACWDRN